MVASFSSVSVVIAAHQTGAELDACLRAYASELQDGDELIAVVGQDEARCEVVRAAHRQAVVLCAPVRDLTPALWSRGLLRAHGDVIRVTIHPCVPTAGWRAALLEAHADGVTAAGGAIAPGPKLRWRDWAILLLRYRSFVPPFTRKAVSDVPGDHANYVRAALDSTRAEWREAFWEWEVNHTLVANGARFVLDPQMVATYVGGESAWRFVRQRFRHGVRFGRSRLSDGWSVRRLALIVLFVLPGIVFLAKIVSHVLGMPGYRRRLLVSFGWLTWFLSAWSLGEWVGAIRGSLPSPHEEQTR